MNNFWEIVLTNSTSFAPYKMYKTVDAFRNICTNDPLYNDTQHLDKYDNVWGFI